MLEFILPPDEDLDDNGNYIGNDATILNQERISKLTEALNIAIQLADVASDCNLDNVEIDGKMMPIYEIKEIFKNALEYSSPELNAIENSSPIQNEMVILDFNMYTDGGTIEITTNKGIFCFDNRMHSVTKGKLYWEYPKLNNSNLLRDSAELESEIINALKNYDNTFYASSIEHFLKSKQ